MKISIVDNKDLGKIIDVMEPKDIYELAAITSEYNWSPSEYQNGKRAKTEFIKTEIIALDVDKGCTLDAAKLIFKDYKHVIATSKSHQKEKNGIVTDRFRVILFLKEQIRDENTFKATFKKLQKQYPFIDAQCSDVSRFFYPSATVVSISPQGAEVGVETYIETPKIERVEAPQGERGELWKSTLDFLLNGARPGHRHGALLKAVGNMREQGYTKEEVLSKLDELVERTGDTAFTDSNALKTVDRMYERELKYSFEPKKQEDTGYIAAFELVDEAIEYLADKKGVAGEPTGIEGLDKLLGGGFRKGELTVLMAQAKTGKNTFLHVLLHSYLKRNIAHGYASRELSPGTEVIPNLLSIALGLNAWTQDINENIRKQFVSTAKDWQLYFAPGYGHFPIEEMEDWFCKLKDIGVDYFLFDHFHYALLKEDYEATSHLIKKLKSLTKELDIHIALIVQPRSLREDESLSLSTLRGGAAIGQALDNLMILERVKTAIPNISKLSLEVARHKLAKTGHIYLEYDPKTTQMTEVEKTLLTPQQAQSMPDGSKIPSGYKASPAFNTPKIIFNEN